MDNKAEVVVIGGGIVGTSVAFHLARRGVRDIVLLERRELTAGSTGRSSGIVRQFYLHPAAVEMARYGLQFYREFARVVGTGDAGFVNCGWVVGGTRGHLPLFEKALELQKQLGAQSRIINRQELSELVPGVAAEDVECGFYEPESGYADPAGACIFLAAAAARVGVQIRQGVEATNIRLDGQGVVAVDTPEGPVFTRTVVNAAGPWAKRVARMVGIDLPVETSRHHVITIRRPVQMRPDQPCYSDPFNLIYVRPESGEKFLVGSNDPRDAQDHVDPDLCPARADQAKIVELAERSIRRFPLLAEQGVAGDWSGVYTITPDGFPILDQLPNVPGFYLANGLSGHGFKLGPAIGRMVASLILDSVPEQAVRAFRLSRFTEGDLINSPTTTSLTTMRAQQ